jgi:hypothetical protein
MPKMLSVRHGYMGDDIDRNIGSTVFIGRVPPAHKTSAWFVSRSCL